MYASYNTCVMGQVLNGGADVFRCIAAEWKSIEPDSVNDSLRQQAKQVCVCVCVCVPHTRILMVYT
jgi:hypothetical protein